MKIFSFVTKKFLIYVGVALVLIIGISFGLKNGNGKQVATVARTNIIQEVVATGKVKPNESVELGFDQSGRVGAVYARVGDTVLKGQTIASLSAGSVMADVSKANALLLEERIKLREIQNTAPISFADASKNLLASIQTGFGSADNAVRNQTDQFFKSVPDNPRFEVSITSGNFIHYFEVDNDLKIDLNNARKEIEIILNAWQARIPKINNTNLVVEADLAINDLKKIAIFLDKIASAVNSFDSDSYTYETTVSGYKADINTARSDISTAISALVTAKDKFNNAPTLGTSGQFESVLTQEAKVRQAEANLANFESSLGDTVIRAPFDGVITMQEAKVGGAVSPGTSLVSIISQNDMYIEANISEINIGKISVGDKVSVSLDAFPGEKFEGEVSYIEPGDLILDGVVNYKVRVMFKNFDPKIKSGLTANLNIEVDQRVEAVSLPLYTIIKEEGQNFVNKRVGKNVQKVPVTIGISGNNGLTEILSGLEVGDQVEF